MTNRRPGAAVVSRSASIRVDVGRYRQQLRHSHPQQESDCSVKQLVSSSSYSRRELSLRRRRVRASIGPAADWSEPTTAHPGHQMVKSAQKRRTTVRRERMTLRIYLACTDPAITLGDTDRRDDDARNRWQTPVETRRFSTADCRAGRGKTPAGS